MTVVWDKIKKNLIESLNLAIDKTEELTSVGRIKLEILQLEQRLDEKFGELGKTVYKELSDQKKTVPVTEKIKALYQEIKSLESEMGAKEKELGRIKEEDGIDL